MSRTGAIAIGLTCLLLAVVPARAQEGGDQARALLEQGAKSQISGQHRLAVQTLTRVLGQEGLSPNEIAKALYYRGLAYKEINRPEQAIADLTGALFLSGLTETERATAEQARQAAFRDGGTAAVAEANRAGTGPTQGAAPAAQGPAFSTRVETASAEPPSATPQQPAPPAFSTSVSTSGSRDAPPAQQRVAAAPPPPTSFSTRVDVAPQPPAPPPPTSFRTTIAPSAEPAPRPAPRPAPAPAPAPQQSAPAGWSTSVGGSQQAGAPQPEAESGGSRLGRFFSNITDNLTGDSSSQQGAQDSAPATSWVQTTTVGSSGRQQTAAAPPAPRPTPAAPAPSAPQPAPGGGYRIQIAALPSEAEAQATWKRLAAKHNSVLAGKQPIIQRTDLGTLGIFYRVQLGPYADQSESQRLCNDFKRSGLDCFVTAQ